MAETSSEELIDEAIQLGEQKYRPGEGRPIPSGFISIFTGNAQYYSK